MKGWKSVMKKAFPLEEVDTKKCEICGNVYKLYRTNKGIFGACKQCSDNEMVVNLNLPTIEEYKKEKEIRFIGHFKRGVNDLEQVTVNSYKPDEDYPSQSKAKQEAIKFVRTFEDNKSQSLVLSGNTGLGKSHLAYSIGKAIQQQGYKTLFIKSTDLLEDIRSTYNNRSSNHDFNMEVTENAIFKMIADLDLLILDDVGSEYVKVNELGHESWASDVLFKFYDSRLGKAMISTTNYNEEELVVKYGNNGPRIVDRMLYNATAIRLEGNSYRRKTLKF